MSFDVPVYATSDWVTMSVVTPVDYAYNVGIGMGVVVRALAASMYGSLRISRVRNNYPFLTARPRDSLTGCDSQQSISLTHVSLLRKTGLMSMCLGGDAPLGFGLTIASASVITYPPPDESS